ncbi:MAG: type IV secretory system conjugative DNA transfer family protein [Acidimicrobiales bacterium]
MADKSKVHWPTAMTIYFLAGAALALIGYSVRYGSVTASFSALLSGAATAGVIALATALLFGVLWFKRRTLATVVLARLSKVWHIVLGWLGAGLASFGIAELLRHVGSNMALRSAVLGPLAFLALSDRLLVLLGLAAWTVGVGELAHRTELAEHEGGGGSILAAGRKVRKAFGSDQDWAPGSKPAGAHFVHIESDVSSHIIPEDELGFRITLAVASLASTWGRKKVDVHFGLGTEGSAIVLGAPGSGKSLMIIGALLSLTSGNPIKVIVTSTKPRDVSGPTTKHLREQGFNVRMLDLTGSIGEDDRYGDPTSWSPLSLCLDDDSTKKTAERLVAAAQGANSRVREEFWAIQTGLLLWPNLRAAVLGGKNLEWAYRGTLKWSDPNYNETDMILFSKGKSDALLAWQGTRKFLLDKEGDLEWKEKNGLSGAGGTGMSIDGTLRGLMNRIATQSAYRATAHPNLILKDWIRSEENEILFLVGDMSEEFTTRSLFAVALQELLAEAGRYANTRANEKLDFSMICLLDEFSNLSPVEGIERFYATVRSIGLQIITFFQSPAQITEMLGGDAAKILIGASALTIVMPGIKDPSFISDLSVLAGQKQVELNDGVVTTQPLVDGSYITGMQSPNFVTGAPGDALAMTKGGFTELKIPWWSLEERYLNRGVVPEDYIEATDALRKKNRSTSRKIGDYLKAHRERATEWAGTKMGRGGAAAAPTSTQVEHKHVRNSVEAGTPPPGPGRMLVRSTVMKVTPLPRGTENENRFSSYVTRCGMDGFVCDSCARLGVKSAPQPPAREDRY